MRGGAKVDEKSGGNHDEFAFQFHVGFALPRERPTTKDARRGYPLASLRAVFAFLHNFRGAEGRGGWRLRINSPEFYAEGDTVNGQHISRYAVVHAVVFGITHDVLKRSHHNVV